jgi:hypothetical protein
MGLRLDVEGPDHVTPLLGFVGDVLSEVRGRAHKRCAAQVSKPNVVLHDKPEKTVRLVGVLEYTLQPLQPTIERGCC